MAELNETTSGNRIHIAFFGRRNAGKSTLVNLHVIAVLFGRVPLGEERVRRSLEVLEKTDVAVWVEADGPDDAEGRFRAACAARNIPILVYRRGDSVVGLKRRIAEIQLVDAPRPLIADLVRPGDTVICVCPIDESAPRGRLILPQQQIVRELLDAGAAALVCQPEMLGKVLASCPPPRFVITTARRSARCRRLYRRRFRSRAFQSSSRGRRAISRRTARGPGR